MSKELQTNLVCTDYIDSISLLSGYETVSCETRYRSGHMLLCYFSTSLQIWYTLQKLDICFRTLYYTSWQTLAGIFAVAVNLEHSQKYKLLLETHIELNRVPFHDFDCLIGE